MRSRVKVTLVGAALALTCVGGATAAQAAEYGIDVERECQSQDSNTHAYSYGPTGNINSWFCSYTNPQSGLVYLSSVDMGRACVEQHPDAPWAWFRDFQDRNSWYCHN